MAPKKKTPATSNKAARNEPKKQTKPVSKSSKRKAVEEEIEGSDNEDFGNVAIDMGSSDEEEEENHDEEGEDEETQAFPEISLSDDDEDDEDFEADSEELDDEDEEDDEEDFDDEEMEEGDLLEEDVDEELERELEREQLEDESDEEDDGFKIPPPYRQHYDKEKLPEIEANYESDSSTEETENTIGNVPLEWYKDLPHIGYDVDGKKILKPATADELDKFLATMEDPDSWKTVKSDKEGKDIVLNDEELDIIQRLQRGIIPDSTYNPYEPTVEWFTSKTETMPLSARPEPKRRFIPSKWEARKVMKIVRAIRQGRIIPRKPKDEKPRFYNLWGDDDTPREDHIMHVAAPKMKLPEHDESYNPPAEYLPDENEIKQWNEMDEEDRPKNYVPKKYNSLRHVPAYDRFMQERFQRCLDLYLAPRVRKNRLNIDPESLVPKLPSPKDLRPFPTHQSIAYEGHTARIRALSIHPSGLYALSGSDDNTCRLWEVLTGRCLMMWKFDAVIHAIAWCPNPDVWLFGISVGHGEVHLISPPKLCSAEQAMTTDQFTKAGFAATTTDDSNAKQTVSWMKPSEVDEERYGYKVRIQHTQVVKQITWHRKGDYIATVSPDAKNLAVLIHQITKHQTQSPFKRLKGLVQKVAFHPIKPIFFVATQIYVRIYDLMQQQLIKTLQTSVKWVSSIDIHPGGDNVIIGSYDKKVCWFDLDLSSRPYKSLRYHTKAVRQVSFHKRYPLFASSSDDGTIQIFYGMVYNDLLQNPLIVPVKILRGHDVKDGLGVLNIEFHPTQPWIFSTGSDGSFRLWT
ncbi:MAG: NUC169 domain-containing protein [Benjaminiella poitrasii]|nr:MAG: NUC169 domain-containing protein [Benjaminiella poitrasii]